MTSVLVPSPLGSLDTASLTRVRMVTQAGLYTKQNPGQADTTRNTGTGTVLIKTVPVVQYHQETTVVKYRHAKI